MKALKYLGILALIYVGLVITFESLLGYVQPQGDGTLVITTYDEDQEAHTRVVSRLEYEDQMYIAVNHWPRAWYYRTQDNPNILVDSGDGPKPYLTVAVNDNESTAVDAASPLPLFFKILTGFPPRYILRLEPR